MNDRMNTIFGWILFSGIIALGLSSLSGKVFHADRPERPEQLGYVIEGAEETGDVAGPSIGTLLASASAEAGEAVFAKCAACHTITPGGADGIGPNLNGVLGTKIGTHEPSYAYSSALSEHGGDWDYENMNAWLSSPRAFASGTKMAFPGLSSAEDRANIILYLRANGGGPELPAPEAAAPETAAADPEGEPVTGADAAGALASENPVAESGAAVGTVN